MDKISIIDTQNKIISLKNKEIAKVEEARTRAESLRESETERANKYSKLVTKEIKRKKRWRNIAVSSIIVGIVEGMIIKITLN